MGEEESYKVIITKSAASRYQNEVLPYLFDNFSNSRAIEIDENIANKVSTLSHQPFRGSLEKYLASFNQKFRFILYKETSNFEIKIIYFVLDIELTVFVTDFFPTKMNPQRIGK